MTVQRFVLTLGMMTVLYWGAAQAALIPYTANGDALVFDDDYGPNGLTWTKDANLFKTQYDADNTVVDQIIAAVPSITHTDSSIYANPYSITVSDFDTTSGRMSWFGAMAWAEWLGITGYGGASDWRLWSALNSDGTGPCYGPSCTDSEFGHLNYVEGGLNAGQYITSSTVLNADLGGVFINLQGIYLYEPGYWSGTEYAPNHDGVYVFLTGNPGAGDQGVASKAALPFMFYGWAVRPGFAAAPEPATGMLMALGMAGIGWSRWRARRKELAA